MDKQELEKAKSDLKYNYESGFISEEKYKEAISELEADFEEEKKLRLQEQMEDNQITKPYPYY